MNTVQSIFKRQIKDYILENPHLIDRSKPNPYTKVANHFNTNIEFVRALYRNLRRKGLVEQELIGIVPTFSNHTGSTVLYTQSTAEIKKYTDKEVRTLDDLIEACDIDTDNWEIISWECKVYDGWEKSTSQKGTAISKKNYSVFAKLRKKTIENDLVKQKQIILEELNKEIIHPIESLEIEDFKEDGILLELCLFDLHLGKNSWRGETGEDYDIKIACDRYTTAINDLLSKTPLHLIDRILLPIGNDMIQIDSRKGMTTAGTLVDSDTRFRKMITVARDLLISTINRLSKIAKVDVIVISGNHDYDTMFSLGMVLEAFYSKDQNVNIDNSAKQRKYYQYYNTGIQLTHGNEERHQDLGLIFATEEKQLWANTNFHEVQLGHYHKNKKLNFTSVDEYQGFQVNILPSLSGSDFWHNSKGYMSLKQAKAFLYSKEDGKIAEFTHNVKI